MSAFPEGEFRPTADEVHDQKPTFPAIQSDTDRQPDSDLSFYGSATAVFTVSGCLSGLVA